MQKHVLQGIANAVPVSHTMSIKACILGNSGLSDNRITSGSITRGFASDLTSLAERHSYTEMKVTVYWLWMYLVETSFKLT